MKILITETQYKLLLNESSSLVNDAEFQNMVKKFEGSVKTKDGKHITYDDKTSKPVVKPSQLQGTLTIGYGTTKAVYPEMKVGEKISEPKATDLLKRGIEKIENKTRSLIPKYDSFPKYVKIAIMNARYRGDLGPKTIELINKGKCSIVSKEYLNHPNYKNPGNMTGVVKRMKSNADAFDKYAKEVKGGSSSNNDDYEMLEGTLGLNNTSSSLKIHRFKTSDGKYRLEVGPYPPKPKGGEGRYLVFFRDGKIKWYNGFKFANYTGSWNTQLKFIEVKGKKGLIDYEEALNQPYANFAD
jgi:GH24 family phage-related lysozyme (muramidase)